MKTIEYRTEPDKAEWGDGPWMNEPDKRQWQDEATGLPCLAVRGPGGHWCGYVGVVADHPLFAKHYDNEDIGVLDVHGGITFGSFCSPGDESHSICHLPDPGEPDHVWWLGFDCAHAGDYAPKFDSRYRKIIPPEKYAEHNRLLGLGAPTGWGGVVTYRDLPFIIAECGKLAAQLVML